MASRCDRSSNNSYSRSGSTLDAAIAEIAGRQKGLIAVHQLRQLGLRGPDVRYRLRIGRLTALDHGVYAIAGLPPQADSRLMARLLRVGPEAAAWRRTAADQWGIRRRASADVEIAYPRRHRRLPGVTFYTGELRADEVTTHDGIPLTTPPRTLFDLAAVLSDGELEVAIGEAEELRLRDPLSLPDLLARYPGRRGTARLRRVLGQGEEAPRVLRQAFERRFFALIVDSGLPRPATNALVDAGRERYECDCVWEDARLIAELDGRRHHERRAAFASDRERDRRLAVAGWRVVRITWEQARDRPRALLADLEALIYTQRPRRRSSVGRALHS